MLADAHIVERAHLLLPERHQGLRLGDQTGILDRRVTEELVEAARGLLADGVDGLAVGEGVADVLFGYLLAARLDVPLASVAKNDGVVHSRGALPSGGRVWLLATLLDEAATLDEFSAACERAGAEPGGVAALVDRLPVPDPRVRSLLRWADHSWEPDACPLCGGGG
jgi:hypothetical protein